MLNTQRKTSESSKKLEFLFSSAHLQEQSLRVGGFPSQSDALKAFLSKALGLASPGAKSYFHNLLVCDPRQLITALSLSIHSRACEIVVESREMTGNVH